MIWNLSRLRQQQTPHKRSTIAPVGQQLPDRPVCSHGYHQCETCAEIDLRRHMAKFLGFCFRFSDISRDNFLRYALERGATSAEAEKLIDVMIDNYRNYMRTICLLRRRAHYIDGKVAGYTEE